LWGSVVFTGRFRQTVYKRYREINGVMVPVADPQTGYYSAYTYDAFSRDDLIPSLVQLVVRASRKGNQNRECKKWIKTNGFLVQRICEPPSKGESLEVFWQEAVKLTKLWCMYTEAVNRDLEALKRYVSIKIERLTLDEIKNEEFLWGKGNDGRVCVSSSLFESEVAFGVKLKEVKEDFLAPYQYAVLHYVAGEVSYNIGNVRIVYDRLTKHENSDTDTFSIQAYLEPASLLQALYLWFFQLLTEKRKVCPTCWAPFTPRRRDQVFCSDGCRFTHHTRKRRGQQRKERF